MALYLGNQKVAPVHKVSIPTPVSAATITGQVDIDENGVLTFPKLDFTPKMITIWNIEARDLKQEVIEEGEEWDNSWVRWAYNGIILTAINIDGVWISQGLMHYSGAVVISNATYTAGSMICEDNGQYAYQLVRDQEWDAFIDEVSSTYNYAIYS